MNIYNLNISAQIWLQTVLMRLPSTAIRLMAALLLGASAPAEALETVTICGCNDGDTCCTTTGAAFIPGTYRLIAHFRGNGITGIRIGLSSTATVEYACVTAVS